MYMYLSQSTHVHTHIFTHTCTHTEVSYIPSLYSLDEVMKAGKLSVGSPDPQSRHVGHVARFRGTSCTAVDDPSLGELLLQLQYGETCLARLTGTSWNEILSLVALVKHDLIPSQGQQCTHKTR